jgi:hypothetical protein
MQGNLKSSGFAATVAIFVPFMRNTSELGSRLPIRLWKEWNVTVKISGGGVKREKRIHKRRWQKEPGCTVKFYFQGPRYFKASYGFVPHLVKSIYYFSSFGTLQAHTARSARYRQYSHNWVVVMTRLVGYDLPIVDAREENILRYGNLCFIRAAY